MRKGFLTLLLLLTFYSFSQNKQILYNFTAVPQSMLTNPAADFKYKFYLGVPLLSGVSFNGGNTGFSAYDLFADNGVDFNDKLRSVVYSTTRKDYLALNEQLEIINGGFKLGDWMEDKGYLSFGVYQEFDFLSYMPKDLAILTLDGNRDYIGRIFEISDLCARAEAVTTLHLGYHKNVSDKLILGARGKIYFSGFNASSVNNYGTISTFPSSTTFYEQIIDSHVKIQTSGISQYTPDGGYSGDIAKDIKNQALFGGDLGLGFDLGFTYYPKENTQITGSIIDVGFVKHSKDPQTYTYEGYYKYEGLNPDFTQFNNPVSIYNNFNDAIPLDTLYNKYTTWRPMKINASYQYSFGTSNGGDCDCKGDDNGYSNSVGAQFFMMSTPREPIAALTAFYRRKFMDGIELKATYTLDSYSYDNIGLGLSANIGKFNMYLMAGNLLEYQDLSKANSLSFQLGFNFVFKDSNEPF